MLIALDVGGPKATTALNEARRSSDLLRDGKPLNDSTDLHTLGECYAIWRDTKPLSRNSTRERKATSTLNEAERVTTLFAKDWLDLRIADISAAMIRKRALDIETGNIKGTNGSTAVARSFLRSLAAIVTSTEEFHEEPNRFRMIMRKYYGKPATTMKKKSPRAHRVLTDQEIALILNASRDDFRFKMQRGGKRGALKVTPWRKILAMKFQLLSGFRIGGVIGLKVEDINGTSIDRDEMDKTGNEHRLPITRQLRELIDEAIALKNGTDSESPDDWMLTSAGIVASPYLFSFASDGSRFDANGSGTSRLFIDARNLLAKTYGDLPLVQGQKQSVPTIMQSHDCRVTLRVFARRCGLSRDQAKDLLGHSRNNGDITDDYDDYETAEIDAAFDDLSVGLQKIHNRLFEIAEAVALNKAS